MSGGTHSHSSATVTVDAQSRDIAILTKDAAKLRDKLAALFSDVVSSAAEVSRHPEQWAEAWQPGFLALSKALNKVGSGRDAARLDIGCDKIAAGIRAFEKLRESQPSLSRIGVVGCAD